MEEDGKDTSLPSRQPDKFAGHQTEYLEMEQRKETEDCLLVSLASMANRVVVATLSLVQMVETKGWDQKQAARED